MDKEISLGSFYDIVPPKKEVIVKSSNSNDKYGHIYKMILQNTAQAKLLHWQSLRYGQHIALDGLFSGIIDLGDELAETLMGKYGRPVLSESDLNLKLMNFKSPEEGDLTEFMNHLTKCYQSDCRSLLDEEIDTDLINIVDEILALVNKTKYLVSLK